MKGLGNPGLGTPAVETPPRPGQERTAPDEIHAAAVHCSRDSLDPKDGKDSFYSSGPCDKRDTCDIPDNEGKDSFYSSRETSEGNDSAFPRHESPTTPLLDRGPTPPQWKRRRFRRRCLSRVDIFNKCSRQRCLSAPDDWELPREYERVECIRLTPERLFPTPPPRVVPPVEMVSSRTSPSPTVEIGPDADSPARVSELGEVHQHLLDMAVCSVELAECGLVDVPIRGLRSLKRSFQDFLRDTLSVPADDRLTTHYVPKTNAHTKPLQRPRVWWMQSSLPEDPEALHARIISRDRKSVV